MPSQQQPAHKLRGRGSPRQHSKFPRVGRESSDNLEKKVDLESQCGGDVSVGQVGGLNRCEDRSSIGRGRKTSGEGRVIGRGRGIGGGKAGGREEVYGKDMGKMVDSIVTADSAQTTKDISTSFREHHVAKVTTGQEEVAVATTESHMTGDSTEIWTGRHPKKKTAQVSKEVGVVDEVKGERYGVTYGSTESKVVSKKVVGDNVSSESVVMETGASRTRVGVIGEGRTKKKGGGAKQGDNEKGVGSDVRKGSESDVEDLTNDQWDSSEEVDLLGEGGSDEEGERGDTHIDNEDLEAEIEEGGALKEPNGQEQSKLGNNQIAKATPLSEATPTSPDQWQHGSSGADMWRPHSDLFPSTGKRPKCSLALAGALSSTLSPKYTQEGEFDERNFSLSRQNFLVSQLVSEYRSMCSLAEDHVNPRRDDVVSLKCLLQSSKLNSFHSYLPDHVTEQMFKDRSVVPSLLTLVQLAGGRLQVGLQGPDNSKHASMNLSKLLKIASVSAERREQGVSSSGDLCEDDPAIVQRIAVPPAERATGIAKATKVPFSAVVSKPQARDMSGVVVDDPSIVSISPESSTHDLSGKVVTSAAEAAWNSSYESEDPLPNVPSIFPSALPTNDGYSSSAEQSRGLGDLFAAFSNAGFEGTNAPARLSQAHDKFVTPPQSPVVIRKGGGKLGGGDAVSVRVVAPSGKISSEVGGSKGGNLNAGSTKSPVLGKFGGIQSHDQSMKSHDQGLKSHDHDLKSHDQGPRSNDIMMDTRKLSVQDLEQLMVNTEEAYFSADSGDNAPNLGSNGTQTHSGSTSANSARADGKISHVKVDPLPTLEKWEWQKGPSSMESWSPGSDSATADSAIAILDDTTTMDVPVTLHYKDSTGGTTGGVAGVPQHSEFPVGPESDLNFLTECFPDLEEGYLEQLLFQNDGNVEEAVSMALLSVSPLSPLSSQAYFGIGYETQTSNESSRSGGSVSLKARGWNPEDTTNDEVLARALQDKLDHENGDNSAAVADGGGLHLENGRLHLGSNDDEEIARILEEELNCSGDEHVQSGDKTEHLPVTADENLVLKLTPSLARQLQNLFGSVHQHLPNGGK
jgi:hypothetical protein